MKFELNFRKKHFYALIAVLAVFAGLAYVIAQATIQPLNPGHTGDQIFINSWTPDQPGATLQDWIVSLNERVYNLEQRAAPTALIGTLRKTARTTTGRITYTDSQVNLVGLEAANKICEVEFGFGWVLARATEFTGQDEGGYTYRVASLATVMDVYGSTECQEGFSEGEAWVNVMRDDPNANCGGWQQTGNARTVWYTAPPNSCNSFAEGRRGQPTCATERKLLCIKVS